MLTYDEALEICLDNTRPLGTERVALHETLGRVLAEDVTSRREHPPWNNSAMDGYAVKWTDVEHARPEAPAVLNVIGEIQAGGMPSMSVQAGQAVQIMTGAPMPEGADTVVRIEETQSDGDRVSILRPGKALGNVRNRGEDIHHGQTVLEKGTLCRPAEVGMLATADVLWTNVYRRPLVSVLATGNELAEPGTGFGPEKIINSNTFSITALSRQAGCITRPIEVARDDKADLTAKIRQVLTADIGLVVGGVSVGKYDYVKDVLLELGCDMKFWRVKMRPGHPVAFGVIGESAASGHLLFGLPGNPVACMVAFYQFVRPVVRKLMGMHDLVLSEVTAELEEDVKSRAGRRHFARAITSYRDGRYYVRLTGAQGSGILTSMVRANSFLVLPESGGEFARGTNVPVQLLPAQ